MATGVTDVRLHLPVPPPRPELTERLATLVAAFRAAVGHERVS